MHRLTLCLLFAVALHAQDPTELFNRPPAGVDEALRARITEFYQLHVKQEFRKAEGLVAEDTQEFFYRQNKPQYLSFEIKRIDYSNDFTRAKATMVTEQYIMMPGFMDKPVKIPSGSTWKLENGKWCWFVDQELLRETPFGKMTPGPPSLDRLAAAGLPTSMPTTADYVLQQVKADKQSVTVKPGESAEVTFTNTAPGYMNLNVIDELVGVEARFNRTELKPNDTAVLTIVAAKDAKSGVLGVRVKQTIELIRIGVIVK